MSSFAETDSTAQTTTTNYTVNSPAIITSSIFLILFPIILSFIWIKYHQGKIVAIATGMLGLIVSFIIEIIIISLISLITGRSSFFLGFLIILFPGIFEETGRLVCFKYILKNHINTKITSVSYGIGHFGIKSILLGFGSLIYLFVKEEKLEENITFLSCLFEIIDDIWESILHISLSVFVFKTIKDNKLIFYLIAIGIHDFSELFKVLYRNDTLTNLTIYEIVEYLISFGAGIVAYKIYQTFIDINGEYSEFSPIGNDSLNLENKEMGARANINSS